MNRYAAMVPAFCVLGVFLVLTLTLLFRLRRDDLLLLYSGRSFFLFGMLTLVFVFGGLSLFEEQAWATDVVKVAVGAFIGAGAASLNNGLRAPAGPVTTPPVPPAPPADAAEAPLPSPALPAPPAAPALPVLLDHDLHFVSNRRNPVQDIQNITETALRDGWNLASVEVGAQFTDGLLLVFTRPSAGAQRRLRFVVDGSETEVSLS